MTIPHMIRAIDPIDGDPIYLAEHGGWTRDPACAARAMGEREARALLAVAGMQPDVAEAPELVPAPAPRRRAAPVSRPAAGGAWQSAAAGAR